MWMKHWPEAKKKKKHLPLPWKVECEGNEIIDLYLRDKEEAKPSKTPSPRRVSMCMYVYIQTQKFIQLFSEREAADQEKKERVRPKKHANTHLLVHTVTYIEQDWRVWSEVEDGIKPASWNRRERGGRRKGLRRWERINKEIIIIL